METIGTETDLQHKNPLQDMDTWILVI